MSGARLVLMCTLAWLCACGDVAKPAERLQPLAQLGSPFVTRVVRFAPGTGAGFGADAMPTVVMGPPDGYGANAGSTDVVSLGDGGEIVVELGRGIDDVAGVDFTVFENPFMFAGGTFSELGEVSVSIDASAWAVFACDAATTIGCAGVTPVFANDIVSARDPTVSGGDSYDLSALDDDVTGAQFVRIRAVGGGGFAPSLGFDLDAVAVVSQPPL